MSRWDCSEGSTKVKTIPGLLARAVLQGHEARHESPPQARTLLPARHTLALPPASPMDVGLRGGGQIEVEHSAHVVEVYSPGHAGLRIRSPVGKCPRFKTLES